MRCFRTLMNTRVVRTEAPASRGRLNNVWPSCIGLCCCFLCPFDPFPASSGFVNRLTNSVRCHRQRNLAHFWRDPQKPSEMSFKRFGNPRTKEAQNFAPLLACRQRPGARPAAQESRTVSHSGADRRQPLPRSIPAARGVWPWTSGPVWLPAKGGRQF